MGDEVLYKLATVWGPLSLFVGISYLLWKQLVKVQDRERDASIAHGEELLKVHNSLIEAKHKDIELKRALVKHLTDIHAKLGDA